MSIKPRYQQGIPSRVRPPAIDDRAGEKGITLLEVVFALVILMIALLGVCHAISYAIVFNAGNDARAQALAVLQEEVEYLRSLKYVPTHTDTELRGGIKATKFISPAGGGQFAVDVSIDNNPSTTAIDDETSVPNPALKEIIIEVRQSAQSSNWQASVPARIVMRRVRGN